MQKSVYDKVKRTVKVNKRSNITKLISFSNTEIKVLGEVTLPIKFEPFGKSSSLRLVIVDDISNTPNVLFGDDFLRQFLVNFSYEKVNDRILPRITLTGAGEESYNPVIYSAQPNELLLCKAWVSLKPFESKSLTFYLHPAAQVVSNDQIIVTSRDINPVMIVPSKTELEYLDKICLYTCTVLVHNSSNKMVNSEITGKFERIRKSDSIKTFCENNNSAIRKEMSLYGLAKEILNSPFNTNIPEIVTVTLNNISGDNQQLLNKNFILSGDESDVLFLDKPSFAGEGEISERVLETEGIEIPTLIHSNATDAIQLSTFPPEIQPFIKDIFIDKYPNCVSLHSLDAGDVSKTLGYTILKLREGESLPRAKRLFHLAPTESRHLTDIIDYLIKFNYIQESPIDPCGMHLYGLASYLVQRAKPNTIGRLIVDFSPINPILESPASVIPEINTTLQFLYGKCMFSSLDMRYAASKSLLNPAN